MWFSLSGCFPRRVFPLSISAHWELTVVFLAECCRQKNFTIATRNTSQLQREILHNCNEKYFTIATRNTSRLQREIIHNCNEKIHQPKHQIHSPKCSKYEKDKDGNQDKRQVAFMMVGPQGERYIRGGGNTAVLNIPPSYQLLGLPLNYNKHHIIQ